MTNSDGNSAAPPLRKRKSKRFDRSGSNKRTGGPMGATTTPAIDVDEPGVGTEAVSEVTSVEAAPEKPSAGEREPAGQPDVAAPAPAADDPTTAATHGSASNPTPGPATPSVVTDGAVRSKTLDERQACGRCGHELSMVNIEVDGNVLIMESCDNCDARRWHLAGEPINLQKVLDHVGEHAGRRR
ncbi:MAG: hypothetical protein OER95_14720 [Acidimicrobiia bacterium]|nr:hypothetical protein [Acidimicrobiia bacterium]